MNRREFLRVSALTTGALVIGVQFSGCSSTKKAQREMEKLAAETGEFAPNMYITVMPDNRVLVAVEKSEMGQGVLTSHAMLVAEELDVPLDQIDAFSADGAPQWGMQMTGGSTSTSQTYIPVRTAAASAKVMLLGAAAAKWGVPAAELEGVDGVVRHAASGRKETYGALAKDAAKQPIPQDPPLKNPADFKVLGKKAIRTDARAKVDGTAVFGMDVVVDGMVNAYIVRPRVMGAKPLSFDGSAAKKEPGVVDVIGFERGVAVLAEKYWQARRAALKLEIEWSDSRHSSMNTAKIRAMGYDAVGGKGTSYHNEGNVKRAMKREGVKTIEAIYEAPFLAHATMSPQNCTAHVRENEVEIWAPTQAPPIAQEVASRITGIPRDKVIAHVTLLGGGFGRRAGPDFVAEAVELSKRCGRPVKVVWSREDDMSGGYYRPFAINKMEGGVDADGKPIAWRYHSVSQPISTDFANWLSVIFPDWMPNITTKVMTRSIGTMFRSGLVPEVISTEGARHVAYDIENQSIEFTPLQTTVPVTFWRSVGHSYNGFVVESFSDELAHLAGEDPFEFRRKHIKDPRLKAVLERAAKEAGWGEPTEEGYGRGIAAHFSFDSYVAEVVEAGLKDGEIDVRRVTCVVDCGVTVNPDIVKANMESSIIFGLSAAIWQKITFEDGVVQQGNFDDYPLMRMFQTPEIDVHIMESNAPPTGVGEPGLPPAAPALANAIFAANGIRMRKMPFVDALADHFEKEG